MNVESASAASLVRSIRVARGLTQEGLARELGVSFATINGWENGRHQPMPALQKKLVELAGQRSLGAGFAGNLAPARVPEEPARLPEHDVPQDVAALAATSGWPFEGRERRDLYRRP